MSHQRLVRSEFTRQAESFARAEVLSAAGLTEPVAEALSDLAADRVLDLACGPAVLVPALARVARRVVGLDGTRRTLEVGAARCGEAGLFGVRFVQGLAESTPFASGSFDAVVLRLALHHVQEPAAVLGEVHRLLRPGGRLVVLDILGSERPDVARLHDAVERLRDPSHARLLAASALRAALASAQLTLRSESVWRAKRGYGEWAAIISQPVRMDALEQVLRAFAGAGIDLGIGLRIEDGQLCFDYPFGLFVATR